MERHPRQPLPRTLSPVNPTPAHTNQRTPQCGYPMKKYPDRPMSTRGALPYDGQHLREVSLLTPAPWRPHAFLHQRGGVMYEKSEYWEKELQAGFIVVAVDQQEMDWDWHERYEALYMVPSLRVYGPKGMPPWLLMQQAVGHIGQTQTLWDRLVARPHSATTLEWAKFISVQTGKTWNEKIYGRRYLMCGQPYWSAATVHMAGSELELRYMEQLAGPGQQTVTELTVEHGLISISHPWYWPQEVLQRLYHEHIKGFYDIEV